MVYVCSDIHGLYDRYIKAIELLSDKDVMYILGDVIDRGQDGIRIIKDIMARKNTELILGNHEYMMLNTLSEHSQYWDETWCCISNSGGITKYMFEQESRESQNSILSFLNECYLARRLEINGQTFILTHSAPPPYNQDIKYKECDDDTKFDITWYSPFRSDDLYLSRYFYAQEFTYIIGHVPVQKLGQDKISRMGNIIDIDCGCAYQHLRQDTSLAVLRLDDQKEWYLR